MLKMFIQPILKNNSNTFKPPNIRSFTKGAFFFVAFFGICFKFTEAWTSSSFNSCFSLRWDFFFNACSKTILLRIFLISLLLLAASFLLLSMKAAILFRTCLPRPTLSLAQILPFPPPSDSGLTLSSSDTPALLVFCSLFDRHFLSGLMVGSTSKTARFCLILVSTAWWGSARMTESRGRCQKSIFWLFSPSCSPCEWSKPQKPVAFIVSCSF